MKNKFKINGLWISYQILIDKNLRDKEKIIYSLILFYRISGYERKQYSKEYLETLYANR